MLFDPAWSWPINVSLASSLRMNLAVTAFRAKLPLCCRLRLLSAFFSADVFRGLQRLPPCEAEVAAASAPPTCSVAPPAPLPGTAPPRGALRPPFGAAPLRPPRPRLRPRPTLVSLASDLSQSFQLCTWNTTSVHVYAESTREHRHAYFVIHDAHACPHCKHRRSVFLFFFSHTPF